ncbi:hypothetical protein NHX12_033379 [Muraenolepis orangiensis]|uniref:Uncharacterized protein n=1 Tax=Muraenolepis orangiensis TaxID=630683 RepID=A0A9Q0E4Z4_9TELE|nr:hypothetical protein NHX12_033379 [Muraenolepis orangiensis]
MEEVNKDSGLDSTEASSPSPVPMQANEGFTKQQTLFLINLMRQHLEAEGVGLPKSLKELNARLKPGKGKKKLLWQSTAVKLGCHFSQSFCPDKVARKWATLVDSFKKLKENDTRTGKGTMRFLFYVEMDDLLGAQQDIVFPVVGKSERQEVLRPEALGQCRSGTALNTDFISAPSTASSLPGTQCVHVQLTSMVMTNLVKTGDTDSGLDSTKASSPSPVPMQANEGFTKQQTLFLINLMRQHLEAEDSGLDSTEASSPSPVPVQTNEGFTKQQTLFLINLMRQHLEAEGVGLPKSLKELNARLKPGKGKKKLLWQSTAVKLGCHFSQSFCPDKVARKWATLVDSFKKLKENDTRTGKGTMRFQFYVEMDDLLGAQQDIVFPVVGKSERQEVLRPEALGQCRSGTALNTDSLSAPSSASSPPGTPPATPRPPRKRRKVDDDVMQFLRESEEGSWQRHDEILAQLKSSQQGFESLMSRLLDKL